MNAGATRHVVVVCRRNLPNLSGIFCFFLLCFTVFSSALGRPEIPREKPDFALECTPVFSSFADRGIWLIRCDFKNVAGRELELDTGFFGAQFLSFGLSRRKLFRTHSGPSGGLDNELHEYSVAHGETYTSFIDLNDYLELPSGTSRLQVQFTGRKIPIVSSFEVFKRQPPSSMSPGELRAFVRLAAGRLARGLRTVDLEWILASACRTNQKTKRDVQAIARKCPIDSQESKFLHAVLAYKAWNAID